MNVFIKFIVNKHFNVLILITTVLGCAVNSGSTDPSSKCPTILGKNDWDGRDAVAVEYTIMPVQLVIVHHTATGTCRTKESCSGILRSIQIYQMDQLEFDDIGYNFMIGGDGNIYEGAGWHKVGAHLYGYNRKSLGLAFIGDFTRNRPEDIQLKAAQDFLECAVEMGELGQNYTLVGAKDISSTLSPGRFISEKIRQWPHFKKGQY